MKLKKMKKVLAAALSATMIMGMSMTVAANGEITSTSPTNPTGGSISAPIFSYDITHVVVPTSYGVAFNPDGLEVTVSTATSPTVATTATVASKNYGIINKSSKDKLVKVGLSVSSTEPRETITFVDTAAKATTDAKKGEYKIFLEAVPADATPVKVISGTTPATATATTPTTATQPAKLAHVVMTKAAAGKVPMQLGDNEIAFKLEAATYALKSGESLDLENLSASTSNDVQSKYGVTDLNVNKGVTGFTFDGAMNTNADWTKVSGQIQITPTYTIETTDSSAQVTPGTGAVFKDTKPKFTTGEIGEINYTAGVGDDDIDELVSVFAPWQGAPLDITSYASLDKSNLKVIVDNATLGGWADAGQNPLAEITYLNKGGNEVTVTAILKTH